ncbi:Outer membrane porin [Cupriavidus necator H850]|uniref:porin n=1 Tax=Cupriavidus necator TaxID=106590 RepID=UPI0018929D02|nr:porin [Cupriavidus necator]KAI3596424.1 Outer membrane porin [Cupriavidus necator H850]
MYYVKLKHISLITLVGLAGFTGPALADVLLYGVIDTGIAYVSDIGGQSNVRQQAGGTAASRFGMRGTEDLGAGRRAVFALEGGFNGDDGTLGQSSNTAARIFGRQAWIGLASVKEGTLTFGRQYDFMFDMNRYGSNRYLGAYYLRPLTAGAFIGSNGSSTDIDRLGGGRVDNAVKYVTPTWGGFSAGVLYGLGEQTGRPSAGRSVSATAQYDREFVSVQGTYTMRQDPGTGGKYTVAAGGLAWDITSALSFNALYTRSEWNLTDDKVDVYDVGLRYQMTAPLSLGVGYARYQPNHGASNAILKGKRDQFGVSAQYGFSKRTTVYALYTYQYAHDGGAQLYFLSPSAASTKTQSVVHVGIRHLF